MSIIQSAARRPISRPARNPTGILRPQTIGNLAAWYKYREGIQVTGSGVSQWADQSGYGRHLVQATDANRPALQADGSIVFDGVSDYLKATFILNQPETFYLLLKQVTWTLNDRLMDGGTFNTAAVYQGGTTPTLRIYAGAGAVGVSDLAVNTYGVVATIFNGVSSLIQVDDNTPGSGDSGASNAGGFTLGASATPANYGNIQVKEVLIFSAAHDAVTRARIIKYLNSV